MTRQWPAVSGKRGPNAGARESISHLMTMSDRYLHRLYISIWLAAGWSDAQILETELSREDLEWVRREIREAQKERGH